MLETIAMGFTAGLAAGITRDLVKWELKRRRKRAGSKTTINNYLIVHKGKIERITPDLFDDEGWQDYLKDDE